MAADDMDGFVRSASVFRVVANLAVVGGPSSCHTFRRAEAFASWCEFRRKILGGRDAHVRFASGATLISLWDFLHNEGAVFEVRVIFVPRDGLSVLAVACQRRIAQHSQVLSFRREHERTVADVFDALESQNGSLLARAFLGYESSCVDLALDAQQASIHAQSQVFPSSRQVADSLTLSRALDPAVGELSSDLLSATGLVAKIPSRGIMMYLALSYLVSQTPDLPELYWEDALRQHFIDLGVGRERFTSGIEQVVIDIVTLSHSHSFSWLDESIRRACGSPFQLYDDIDSAFFYEQLQLVRETWDIRDE